MKTQTRTEGNHINMKTAICKPRIEAPEETASADLLPSDFQPPELWHNKHLLSPQSGVLCYGARAEEHKEDQPVGREEEWWGQV